MTRALPKRWVPRGWLIALPLILIAWGLAGCAGGYGSDRDLRRAEAIMATCNDPRGYETAAEIRTTILAGGYADTESLRYARGWLRDSRKLCQP